MSKYDCLKLENQLCFPLYAASKEIVRKYKPILDRLDLTYTQYITMMVMWEYSELNVKELILIAQDTTYYGQDLNENYHLKDLLNDLSKLNFKWIRFLYAYPERIEEGLIETVASNKKIVPYFDIPIQHINDEILNRMNRKINSKQIIEKINLIRKKIPNATLRTTLIVGFPGETDSQFEELLNFVETIKFDRLGCFSYSQEEGTKAALFKNQIEEKTKKKRRKKIYITSEKILKQKAMKETKKTVEVIVDEKTDDLYVGRTKKDLPEVDCCVFFSSKKHIEIGEILEVEIKGIDKNLNLFGTLD